MSEENQLQKETQERLASYEILDDYLLVRLDAVEETTASGIYLPTDTQEKERPRIGTVLAVGNEVTKDKFKKGDKVLFKIWGGNVIKDPKIHDDALMIVLEEDILVKIHS